VPPRTVSRSGSTHKTPVLSVGDRRDSRAVELDRWCAATAGRDRRPGKPITLLRTRGRGGGNPPAWGRRRRGPAGPVGVPERGPRRLRLRHLRRTGADAGVHVDQVRRQVRLRGRHRLPGRAPRPRGRWQQHLPRRRGAAPLGELPAPGDRVGVSDVLLPALRGPARGPGRGRGGRPGRRHGGVGRRRHPDRFRLASRAQLPGTW
jgi:hypothetical protein